jgi:SacI restriction endonuclease
VTSPQNLTKKAKKVLSSAWDDVTKLAGKRDLRDWLDDPSLVRSIARCVNSKIKTYRYVLPTQLASKLANHSLDCTCIQASRGGPGAFDARTVAHGVIVPFDQANDNVLGGSQEPYVNNPLRVPEISGKYRAAQKDREGWDLLCEILRVVEKKGQRKFTSQVFDQVLTEVYRRLSTVRVTYPTPKRASLAKAMELIEAFLAEHSGGDRLLALACALFVTIGRRFRLYSDVRRAKITAADQASGMLADLECVSSQGEVVIAVEVKDRQITVNQIQAKMRTMRQKQVAEIFFVAQGLIDAEEAEVSSLIDHEFTSGHNVYVTDLKSLARVALSLLGEKGRRDFLRETANQLEEYHSEVNHRRAWASLLASA